MALTDGETLRKLLRENPDEGLKILEHDLFGMVSVMQGGALLLSEDLQQPIMDVMLKLETLQQIADLVLHESQRAQAYLEELQGSRQASK
jgi:hypothetical protein